MNVIKNMYSYILFGSKEHDKLNRRIRIETYQKDMKLYYYYDNAFHINLDEAYAKLLDIDKTSYENIIYANCNVYRHQVAGPRTKDNLSGIKYTYLFEIKEEAENKKLLLINLLINNYKTCAKVMNAMENLVEKDG